MKEKLTIQELIVRISEKSGATKKLTAELLRVLPEVITAGLERDGEVRIANLGTFKLKWVKARRARNLKTGASVEVPAHNKLVFYPEKGLKEVVNKDFNYLTYQVVGEKEEGLPGKGLPDSKEEASIPEPAMTHAAPEKEEEKKVFGAAHTPADPPRPVQPSAVEAAPRKRKTIYWLIPLMFVIIALLIVIFYMKNCQDEILFPEQKQSSEEQVIKPSETPPATLDQAKEDSAVSQTQEQPQEPAPKETVVNPPAPPATGFAAQTITTSRGQHLFQVARETYGNPYLWALIYKENQSKIPDPEQVARGTELLVPSLEGTPSKLSRTDSSRVAQGYQMLYEYYNGKGDPQAKDFRFAMRTYTPK